MRLGAPLRALLARSADLYLGLPDLWNMYGSDGASYGFSMCFRA
eukprot:SAG11_NODE_23568_length_386_cov_1.233449_1_plen_43_part_10